MVLQNYKHFIEMTSNMIYIVALGVGLKCPSKIHLNTQCPPPPGFFRVNSFVCFTDNLDISLSSSNSTWELFSLINCVHFAEVYLRTILFILVSLVSGMRIVFATQNQVRQCGPGIPTSPLQSMYWKFSRDIHFPIYSYCAYYRVSHSEEYKVNQLWGVERSIILLSYSA